MINANSIKIMNIPIRGESRVKSGQKPVFPDFYNVITIFLILINMLFFGGIFLSFFVGATPEKIVSALQNGGFSALGITLGSVAVTSFLNLVLGIPVALMIVRKNNLMTRIIDLITLIPIVIPPSVAGLALLISFGRKGLFADIFSFFEIHLAFTFAAIVAAQVLVTLPVFVQVMKTGFKSVEKDILDLAKQEGAKEKDLLFYIYLPLTMKYLATAFILCLLRAAGEFGATIMFAGNLPGKTRTLTTAIYTLSEYNIQDAISLALVLILLFAIPLVGLKVFVKDY